MRHDSTAPSPQDGFIFVGVDLVDGSHYSPSTDMGKNLRATFGFALRGGSAAALLALGPLLLDESAEGVWSVWITVVMIVTSFHVAVEASLFPGFVRPLQSVDFLRFCKISARRLGLATFVAVVIAFPALAQAAHVQSAVLISVALAMLFGLLALSVPITARAIASNRTLQVGVVTAAARFGGLAVVVLLPGSIGVRVVVATMVLAFAPVFLTRRPLTNNAGEQDELLPATKSSMTTYLAWSAVAAITSGLDLVVVRRFDPSQLGPYSIGLSIAALVAGVSNAATAPLTIRVAATPSDALQLVRLWMVRSRHAMALLAGGTLLVVGMLWRSDPERVTTAAIAVLGVSSRALWAPFAAVARGTQEARHLRARPVAEAFTNLGLSVALCAWIGARGAALATLGVAGVFGFSYVADRSKRLEGSGGADRIVIREFVFGMVALVLGVVGVLTLEMIRS